MDLGHAAIIVIACTTIGLVVLWSLRQQQIAQQQHTYDEALNNAILELVSDSVIACDTKGALTYINKAAQSWHGLQAADISREALLSSCDLFESNGYIPLKDDDAPLSRALHGQVVENEDIVIKPNDQQLRVARCTGSMLFGPESEPLGAIIAMRDITEQVQAETTAKEALEIIESSTSIMFKWSADEGWPVEYVSNNVAQIGYTAQDFLNGEVVFSEIIHPDDLEQVIQEVMDYSASGVSQFFQTYRIIDLLGRTRWIDDWTHIVRNSEGSITHYHGFIIDTTEREVTSKLFQDSEDRMEVALLGAELGTWDWDIPSGRIIYNDRWAQMLGYELSDIEAHFSTFEKLINPEDKPGTIETLESHFAGKKGLYQTEFRMRHKNGSWVWILASGKVLERSADGKPLRIAGTHQDISTRKINEHRQTEIGNKMQQAQKLESLGVLAGGIAHDFNNILMAILGNAELAKLELPETSTAMESITEIEQASGQAADLCNQMLAYSGKGRFKVEAVNLTDMVHDITKMLNVSIFKKIDLNFDLDANLPPLMADVSQLRQVVMNLITNASEAIGDQHGTITIATSQSCSCSCFDAPTKSAIPRGDISSCLTLEVTDTGCGMDQQTQSRLFEPFFTTKFTGRGLGMAAVDGIVRSHHGKIDIVSEPGAGTTVKISLPSSEAIQEIDIIDTLEPMASQLSGTILLVDDEDSVRKLGKRILKSLGFEAMTAVNGADAIEQIRANPGIDCVLMDLTMPVMDGYEALAVINQEWPSLPVIISSGYHAQEIEQRLGANALFIQKPYRRDELGRLLQEILTPVLNA
jgi:two-component system, cell cycle sensor histidine kinase and response regulator CckA